MSVLGRISRRHMNFRTFLPKSSSQQMGTDHEVAIPVFSISYLMTKNIYLAGIHFADSYREVSFESV